MSIFKKEVKLEDIKDLDKRYEVMRKTVQYALDKCETEMSDLIEEFNESLPEDSDYNEVDTVDLSMKFDEMRDYVEKRLYRRLFIEKKYPRKNFNKFP